MLYNILFNTKLGINFGIIFINILISNLEFFADNKQSSILISKILSICKDNILFYVYKNVNINQIYNFKECIILRTLVLLIRKFNDINKNGQFLFNEVKLLLTSEKDIFYQIFNNSFWKYNIKSK